MYVEVDELLIDCLSGISSTILDNRKGLLLMGFVKLTCPNCGANVEMSEDREYCFCTYCGTKIVQDKVIVEHKGTVKIDGIANVKSLLNRISLFIEAKDWESALAYCERVLDLDPTNPNAYVSKLLAQTRSTSLDDLFKISKPLEKYDSYRFAIKFVSPEIKAKLVSANDSSIKNNKEIKELFETEESEIAAQINELEAKEAKINKWVSKQKIVTWISGIGLILLFISYNKPIFPIVLVVAGLVLMIIIGKKSKERDSLQLELEEKRKAEVKNKNDYSKWNAWTKTTE